MSSPEILRDEIVNTLAAAIGKPAAIDLLFRYEVTASTTRMRALADMIEADGDEGFTS